MNLAENLKSWLKAKPAEAGDHAAAIIALVDELAEAHKTIETANRVNTIIQEDRLPLPYHELSRPHQSSAGRRHQVEVGESPLRD